MYEYDSCSQKGCKNPSTYTSTYAVPHRWQECNQASMDQSIKTAQHDCQQQVPGMAYVPAQDWKEPYDLAKGFQYGTIFPSLNKPFHPDGRKQSW